MWWTLLLACSTPSPEVQVDNAPAVESPAEEPEPATPLRVHVTIDDLPWQIEAEQTMALSVRDVQRWNGRILDAMSKERLQASAFFNCDRIQPGDGTVEAWSHAGHAIGNHTASHLHAKDVGAKEFIQNTASCQKTLLKQLGEPVKWFRYPYLGYGADAADQRSIAGGLSGLGLRNVPVTAPTSEWVFAFRYRDALAENNRVLMAEIGAAYVEHMAASLDASVAIAERLGEPDVPHTMLLHANELNAHYLSQVLERWRQQGAQFVSVGTAMAHPAFARSPKRVVTGASPWLVRTSDEEIDDELGWFSAEEQRVTTAWPLPPQPWHLGNPGRPDTPQEYVSWMAEHDYLGVLRPGPWPSLGRGAQPPPRPPGKVFIERVSNVELNRSADVWCTDHPESRPALKALAAWVISPQGLDRPAIALPVGPGGCVVAVTSKFKEGVFEMAIETAAAEPL